MLKLRGPADDAVLAPIYETIRLVKAELPPAVTFLGFCGGPWTVATYMVAGHGTPDQAPARLFAYRHPEAFAHLIDVLVEASTDYLVRQLARRCRCCANLRYLGRSSAARTNSSAGALRRRRESLPMCGARCRARRSSGFRAAPAAI